MRGSRRAAGARQRDAGRGHRCRGGVRDGGLPDTAGMANEVVVARSQRNMYDRAVVQAGARLVEVGIALSPIAMAMASGLPPHPTPRHPTGMPKWDGLIGRALSEGRGRGAVAAVAMTGTRKPLPTPASQSEPLGTSNQATMQWS